MRHDAGAAVESRDVGPAMGKRAVGAFGDAHMIVDDAEVELRGGVVRLTLALGSAEIRLALAPHEALRLAGRIERALRRAEVIPSPR